MLSKATNAVIWRRKSTNKATVAYNAKVLTAGISDKPPIPKQQHPLAVVNRIEGPISPKAFPMASDIFSYLNLSTLLNAWTSIKILSTPTANTKNGITSMVNMVVATFRYPKTPKLQNTEIKTIQIPLIPRTIFDSF